MNSITNHPYFKPALLLTSFAGIIIAVAAVISTENHSITASIQTEQSLTPTYAAQILDYQWQALNAEVQQNGKVNVIVELNAPGWDHIKLDPTLAQSDRGKALREYGDAQLAMANQVRSALAASMASYTVTVYSGQDWYVPGVALTVDQAGLNFLRNSPLVESMSEDGKSYPSDQFVTNTPSAGTSRIVGTYLEPTQPGTAVPTQPNQFK